MAVLPILKYPDPRLKEVSSPVISFDAALKQLAADMIETMFKAPGSGLAAPQVGHNIRLIVVDDSPEGAYGERALVLINPEIISRAGEIIFEEGCLSVTDYNANVCRADNVVVKAFDLEGNECEYIGEGRRAVVFQHEIDHLDGVLFIDRISTLKRDLYKRRLKKLARQAEGQ